MALTVSVPAFLLLRFVGGATSAFVMVFGSAIVFDRLAAAGRSELTHYHFAGVGIGMSISAVLVSGLGAIGIGWSGQWLASGAVAAIALAAVMVMIPRRAGSIPPPAPKSTAGFDRRIIPLAIAYGLFGFGYVITATFISVLVRETPSIAAIEPVIWLIVGLAAVPSVALWAWIGRCLGNPASIALACLAESAGVAATVLFDSTAAVLIGGAFLGGTFMGITAVGMTTARKISLSGPGGGSGSDPRRMLGLIVAAFGAGQMAGPAFGGYIAGITGSFVVPSLVASGVLIVAACLVMTVRMPKA